MRRRLGHGAWSLAVVAAVVIGYAAVSRRLERSVISAAMVFVDGRAVAGPEVLGWMELEIGSEGVRVLAEATLTLVLFADASRIDLRLLRREVGVPVRLLGHRAAADDRRRHVSRPPSSSRDSAGPRRSCWRSSSRRPMRRWARRWSPTSGSLRAVRQGLNVESGLNDGICVPLLFIALAIAEAEEKVIGGGAAARIVAEEIGYGIVGGVAAGAVAALVLRFVEPRRLVAEDWLQVIPLAAAALAYGIAAPLGGSGFIAAFVGGLVFGGLRRREDSDVGYLTDATGLVLAGVTFVVFGAVALGPALHVVGWQIAFYAVLSLTVLRMVPVWLALLGHGRADADGRLRGLVRPARPGVDRVRRARARGIRARACRDCSSPRRSSRSRCPCSLTV